MLKVQHVILKIPERETKHRIGKLGEIACLLCGSTFSNFIFIVEYGSNPRGTSEYHYIIILSSQNRKSIYNSHNKNAELNENVNSHKIR